MKKRTTYRDIGRHVSSPWLWLFPWWECMIYVRERKGLCWAYGVVSESHPTNRKSASVPNSTWLVHTEPNKQDAFCHVSDVSPWSAQGDSHETHKGFDDWQFLWALSCPEVFLRSYCLMLRRDRVMGRLNTIMTTCRGCWHFFRPMFWLLIVACNTCVALDVTLHI